MKLSGKKGINLVELVATLVVIGVAVPVLLTMWANVSWRSIGSENVAEATSFARQLMEEVRSKQFDNRANSPWTSSANLGTDPGEYPADSRTFNDVDDYINTTDLNITAPAAGYSRQVKVEYVYPDNTDTWQACPTPVTCVAAGNCTNCSQCCYKRITVNIRRQDRLPGNVTLTTIVSGN